MAAESVHDKKARQKRKMSFVDMSYVVSHSLLLTCLFQHYVHRSEALATKEYFPFWSLKFLYWPS